MSAAISPDRLADAKAVAEKLSDLPKESLLYIAGYVEGCRYKPKERDGGNQKDSE